MGLLIESVKATFSVLKRCPQALILTLLVTFYGIVQSLFSFEKMGISPLTVLIYFLTYLLSIFLYLLEFATFQLVVKDAMLSKSVSLIKCISSSFKKLHKVFGLLALLFLIALGFMMLVFLNIILYIFLTIPLVFLLIPIIAIIAGGVYVFIRLAFSITILMIEDSEIIESMKKSWEISKGKFWSILGAYCLLGLLFIPFVIAVFAFIPIDNYGAGLASSPSTFSLVHYIVLTAIASVPSALRSFLPAAYYLKARGKR